MKISRSNETYWLLIDLYGHFFVLHRGPELVQKFLLNLLVPPHVYCYLLIFLATLSYSSHNISHCLGAQFAVLQI